MENEHDNKQYIIKLLFWGWWAVILLFSLIPIGNKIELNLSSGSGLIRPDYLIHLISFLLFAWIYRLGRVVERDLFQIKPTIKFNIIVFSTSVVSEFIQVLLPYRTFNPYDLLSNLIGASIGVLIVNLTKHGSIELK